MQGLQDLGTESMSWTIFSATAAGSERWAAALATHYEEDVAVCISARLETVLKYKHQQICGTISYAKAGLCDRGQKRIAVSVLCNH